MQVSASTPIRGRSLSLRKKILFSAITLTTLVVFLYAAIVVARTYPIYHGLKHRARGWEGRLFTVDPTLGFAPIPNSRGAEIFPIGPEIPARFDGEGFRVPTKDADAIPNRHPDAITIGCSFTYGVACLAEETYPYALSQLLDIKCINAGVPSYGLSQVLILARRMIPRYRPRYVIVQYSPWLVARSQAYFAPAYYGKVTVPYFAESKSGALSIRPPIFEEWVTDLPVSEYRETPAGVFDFSSFLFRSGAPLFLHDDLNVLLHRLKRVTGRRRRATADGQRVFDEAYGEIARICVENQTKLIILVLGLSIDRSDRHAIDKIHNAVFVDAQTAMIESLPEATDEAYSRAFRHWRGDPLVLVDPHPNARAHKIIAQTLAEAIGRMGK
jgi:hypothetical protein